MTAHPRDNPCTNPDISCRECIDFIADYLDGSLAPAARDEFNRHLAACPPCITYLETYKQTIALGKQAFHPPGSTTQLPEELINAIKAARKKQTP